MKILKTTSWVILFLLGLLWASYWEYEYDLRVDQDNANHRIELLNALDSGYAKGMITFEEFNDIQDSIITLHSLSLRDLEMDVYSEQDWYIIFYKNNH